MQNINPPPVIIGFVSKTNTRPRSLTLQILLERKPINAGIRNTIPAFVSKIFFHKTNAPPLQPPGQPVPYYPTLVAILLCTSIPQWENRPICYSNKNHRRMTDGLVGAGGF
jgi:hypothetical protein